MNDLETLAKLTVVQFKLVLREPLVLAFVFFFPVIFTLVLGGVFDPEDDGFEALPSDYYGVAYIGVAIGAIGLTVIPVQVASYRERGVLRRFRASGIATWVFPASLLIIGAAMAVIASGLVVATCVLSYGLAAPDSWPATVTYFLVATLSFVAFGLALGWLMPNARSAQGVGTLAFFPMFLLGGAGPPPEVLSPTMNSIARFLPLTHVMRAIQEPWLGLEGNIDHVVILVLVGSVSLVGSLLLANRAPA